MKTTDYLPPKSAMTRKRRRKLWRQIQRAHPGINKAYVEINPSNAVHFAWNQQACV